MKKTIFLSALVICLLFAGSTVSANTVTVNLLGVEAAGIDIGSFQLFFYTGGSYQYPLSFDDNTGASDFNIAWGSLQPAASFWTLTDYPITTVGDSTFATGYGAYSNNTTNPARALNDGLVVTLSSANYLFGINPADSRNAFYNFLLPFGEISGLQISETWVAGNQTLNVSAVPIPAAAWLLGSGLLGLVALRRRMKK